MKAQLSKEEILKKLYPDRKFSFTPDEVLTSMEDYMKRLYEWLMEENRKKAETFFTASELRNVAREIEFRLSLSDSRVKELEGEVEVLKAWKKEAISVMPDMQAIGRALNIGLRQSIHDKILPSIERLKEENRNLKSIIDDLQHPF